MLLPQRRFLDQTPWKSTCNLVFGGRLRQPEGRGKQISSKLVPEPKIPSAHGRRSTHLTCTGHRRSNDQNCTTRRPVPNKPASSTMTCASCSSPEMSMAFLVHPPSLAVHSPQSLSQSTIPVTLAQTLVSAGVIPAEIPVRPTVRQSTSPCTF